MNYNNQGAWEDTKAWVNFAVVGRSSSFLIFPILTIPKDADLFCRLKQPLSVFWYKISVDNGCVHMG